MIDLHTHTLLSDGELLPSELVRRAEVKGYSAIALTDHVDASNIDFVLPRLVKVCKELNKYWKIISIPGVEITHVPLKTIRPLVAFSRKHGAGIVVVHGETISEPVLKGTNRAAIEARCDILAHPGNITEEDALSAKKSGVHLELTTRESHATTNRFVCMRALRCGAKMVLNNDAHSDNNLFSEIDARRFLADLSLDHGQVEGILNNSKLIVKNIVKAGKVRNKIVKTP